MLKKIISSILIIPFLIVPMFCCCTTVRAASVQAEHCDDSDRSSSVDHQEHSKSNHSDSSCNCHSFSTAAENAAMINIAFLSFPDSFSAVDVLTLKSVIYPKGSLHLAYLGPPGGPSAVPLYTLYHSLRI